MILNELEKISKSKTTALFIITFFLMIVSNTVGALLSCELRHFLDTNMLAKHLAGIMLIFVFIVLEQKEHSTLSKFGLTFALYTWFIMLMRSRIHFVFANMILFTSLLILEDYKSTLENETRKADIEKLTKVLFVCIIVVTLVGFLSFVRETQKLFKSKWSFYQFWLGMSDQGCSRSRRFNLKP